VGVSVFWQQVIKGVVIVFAVAIDQMQQTLQKRRAIKKVETSATTSGTAPIRGQQSDDMAEAKSHQ
jgi:erythritol transport system permease protein